MLTLAELLEQTTKAAIRFEVADGKLRCHVPPGAMTPAIDAAIRIHKNAMIDLYTRHYETQTNPQFEPAFLQLLEQLTTKKASMILQGNQLQVRSAEPLSSTEIAALRQYKPVIIAGAKVQAASQQIVSKAPPDTEVLASFFQERLWLVEQLEQVDGIYNVKIVLPLSGFVVDAVLVERVCNELVARHPVLRTGFFLKGEQLFQRVMPPQPLPLHQLNQDWAAPTAVVPDSDWVERQISTFCKQPFQLSAGDVIRFGLLQCDARHAVLVIALHHIATDAWSNDVLNKEFVSLYRQYSGMPTVSLPAVPFDYRDYAFWERQVAGRASSAGSRQYWQHQLQGSPPLLVLPSDRYRPEKRSFKGAVVGFTVPTELSTRLEKFGQQRGASPFMLYLTIVQLLLANYSDQADICINSPVANRANPAFKNMVGPCLNSLIFRAKIDFSNNFSALLEQNKLTVQDGFSHQGFPFQQVVADIQPVRDSSYEPVSQVCLVMKLTQPGDDNIGRQTQPVTAAQFDMKNMVENANFDLNFVFKLTSQGLQGWIHYTTDLFERVRIEALARSFIQLSESVLNYPTVPLTTLSWCGSDDQALLRAPGWPINSVCYRDTPQYQQSQQRQMFWQAQLAPVPLAFPADWHREPAKKIALCQQILSVDKTDEPALFGVVAMLLAIYTHQTNFSVGVVGPAAGVLPLAVDFNGPQLNGAQLAAFQSQFAVWCHQVELADGSEVLARCTDFTPAIIVMSSTPADAGQLSVKQLFEQHVSLGLILLLEQEGPDNRCSLWYDSARYQAATMDLLMQRLHLCWQQRAEPSFLQTSLCQFIQAQLIQTQPGQSFAGAMTPPAMPVLQRIRHFAATTAQIAFRQGERTISYSQLDEITDRLALRLQWQLTIKHAIIAIEAIRDLDTMLMYIAILKSGCGVMPLLPELPDQRLSMLLELAKPDLLICRSERFSLLADTVPSLMTTTLFADSHTDGTYRAPSPCPDRPAYVLFTSGSTGTPKTVVVPQKTLDAYCQSWVAVAGLDQTDNQLQFNTLSFDLSIEEIFATLWAGASVVLYPQDKDISVTDFIAVLQHYQITRLRLPTGYWHAICAGLDSHVRQAFAALKSVAIAGEPASPVAVKQWLQVLPAVRLLNNYGPTETTITVSDGAIPLASAAGTAVASRVSIGRNLPHASCYVCTADLQSKPVGMVGELYISGLCLATSYHQAPGLTAAAFLPNPFNTAVTTESRIYATGDLALQRQDGSIEILGRVDSQIKFRGFRIEPHEIAAKMRQLGCQQAEILVVEMSAQTKMLCAFIVSERSAAAVKQDLQTQLPEYMVPAVVMNVAQIPLTSSGKVDQRTLQALVKRDLDVSGQTTALQTDTELILAGLWQQILHLDASVRLSNFFALGGNSLAAVKLSYLLNEHFALQLTIRDIMRTPNFQEQAALIDRSVQIRQVYRSSDPSQSQEELITESF
ncbi:hypothetical protein A5320_02640 [Rheinheimera sp. SA_1]|uniref:non-ribosomal peptide synthetase n=1 Tax=Rheinheimera sp. SA_1 TaxID=1827365 RepID=UPI00080149E8|nr:non-ribosomal peptide synthetase [Rheinheimera sp. SA_1]OBP16325.1 hypothetical protein A5320_02640 [Rheinheimera sp. SA_1]